MESSICSTLSGLKVAKHPRLGILVREDGAVLMSRGWSYGYEGSYGYWYAYICKKSTLIHRIVAESFLPNPFHKTTVDHIDRNRQNNSVHNLRWATMKEQCNNLSTNRPIEERLRSDQLAFNRWFHW